MLTLYGLAVSPPTNKVRFLLNALAIPYELRPVNIVIGGGQSPEHLARHPAGKIPALDDDGFVLFESDAILRYLARKAGSDLYPTALGERARVDQWMDLCTIHVGDGVGKIQANRLTAKFLGKPVNEVLIAYGIEVLSRFLPIVNAQLDQHGHLAGDRLSIADFNLLGLLDPCEVIAINLAPYPAIVRWRNELRQREFYQRCHRDFASALADAAPALKATMLGRLNE